MRAPVHLCQRLADWSVALVKDRLDQTMGSIKTRNQDASCRIVLTLKLGHGLRRWYVDSCQCLDQ